jgi:predicted DCC family thiol-disulfide oxidoreductase YuxK
MTAVRRPLGRLVAPMIVFYDEDCGFCRWTMAWALVHDERRALTAEPIQSATGARLLADLSPDERLRSAHVVHDDGRRTSGGAAVLDVLRALPSTRRLGALPAGPTERVYRLVADHRHHVGRLVPAAAKRRADRVLARRS